MKARNPEPSEFEKIEYAELEKILPERIDENGLLNVLNSNENDYLQEFVEGLIIIIIDKELLKIL